MSHEVPPDLTPLGERELDCMAVLWELGSGTVNEVLEHLGVPLAYTTVLTVLRNLEGKQYLRREAEGRGHRYYPRVARQAAQQSALSRVVSSFFGGSPEALIARLVEERSVSADELARLARELNAGSPAAPTPSASTGGEYPSTSTGAEHASPYKTEGDA